ncbi:MAG TPA: alpha/beta hydrolase [Acidimicrobiales bacterium]|jgi:pimeloyl-ACP methyl ester carboxylesterase
MALPHHHDDQPAAPEGTTDDAGTASADLEATVWRRTFVDGRTVAYATVGAHDAPVLVFSHGWALGHHSYRRVLERIAANGWRVLAPAMPGFGATEDLPLRRFSVSGYARFIDGFLHALNVEEPVVVVGHSFGGAVSIKFAHDHPDRVTALVLVNAVGGAAWEQGGRVRPISERPLWHWAITFPADLINLGGITKVIPAVVEDVLPNAIRNPRAIVRTSKLARWADLTGELETLRERGLPMAVVWSDRDGIIPRASFEAICQAAGVDGTVVSGNHGWLLVQPEEFTDLLDDLLDDLTQPGATPQVRPA